jgi:acetyl esterase/lipase
MKTIFLLLASLCLAIAAMAQPDYINPIYDSRVDSGVVYGIVPDACGRPDTLRMDIYYPVGDNNAARPVMIWLHGGAFIQGKRQDMAMACQALAERGYVAVTADYRLGLFNNSATSPHCAGAKCGYIADSAEAFRASYRAMQDIKGAIRWVKKNVDSICANNVFLGGASAGGIVALQVAYGKTKPASCGAIAQASNATIYSDCALQATGCQYDRGDLGPMEGTLNLYAGAETNVKAVVSAMGAVYDTSDIQPNDPPMLLYHKPTDQVVPFGRNQPFALASATCSAILTLGCGDPNPQAHWPVITGSSLIYDRVRHLNGSIYADTLFRNNCTVDCINSVCHDVYMNEIEEKLYTFLKARIDGLQCLAVGIPAVTKAEAAVHIYPNPAAHRFEVTCSEQPLQLTVYDMTGRKVWSMQQPAQKQTVELSQAAGLYIVQLQLASGTVQRKLELK